MQTLVVCIYFPSCLILSCLLQRASNAGGIVYPTASTGYALLLFPIPNVVLPAYVPWCVPPSFSVPIAPPFLCCVKFREAGTLVVGMPVSFCHAPLTAFVLPQICM